MKVDGEAQKETFKDTSLHFWGLHVYLSLKSHLEISYRIEKKIFRATYRLNTRAPRNMWK